MTTEKQCPTGFSWHSSSSQCIECSKGHIGPNCSLTCPYPWYGGRCLDGQCNCTRDRCDVARGCLEGSPTASTQIHISKKLSSMDPSGMISTLSTTIHHINRMNGSAVKGYKVGATNEEFEMTTAKIVVNNSPTSILITVSGTSISILLLVAIGFQVRSRLFQGPDERSTENVYYEIP
ncbi:uncharacterized protein LOC111125584 [Crassostrea virginica]